MKRSRILAFAFIMVFLTGGLGIAADYPVKPVQLIVPWKAGGDTDALMRVIAHYAGKYLGQSIVVVNVPGVGGTMGARQGKDAKPDGYTLTATHESVVTSFLSGVSDFNYSHFVPIANMVNTPEIVAARKDGPWNNMKELVADAKKRPGEVKFGGTLGSTSHFFPLEIGEAAGIEFKIIGYEGTADRQTALLGGFIDLGTSNPATGKKYFDAKKLKGLGIATEKRHPLLPNMPTLKEQGIDVTFGVNRGICAPLNTPKPIIDKLAQALQKASQDPEYIKRIDEMGTDIAFMDPAGYKAYVEKATQTWSRLADKVGLKKKK